MRMRVAHCFASPPEVEHVTQTVHGLLNRTTDFDGSEIACAVLVSTSDQIAQPRFSNHVTQYAAGPPGQPQQQRPRQIWKKDKEINSEAAENKSVKTDRKAS